MPEPDYNFDLPNQSSTDQLEQGLDGLSDEYWTCTRTAGGLQPDLSSCDLPSQAKQSPRYMRAQV